MSKSIAVDHSISSRHTLHVLVLLGLCLTLLASSAGCRSTSDNQIDLLERELRVQEDYIYELEDYVVEYSEKLRNCRGCSPSQTAVYSEELYEPASVQKRSTPSTRRRTEKEKSVVEPKQDELPKPSEPKSAPQFSPEDLEVPDIDLKLDETTGLEETNPLRQVAAIELDDRHSDEQVMIIPDPVNFEPAAEQAEYADEDYADSESMDEAYVEGGYIDEGYADEEFATNPIEGEQFVEEMFADEALEETSAFVERMVERIEVKQLFRGEGNELSPQNLLTVVEALDANDEPVDLDGEVSLMVMSTDADTPQRLKRWNFTAEETISAWQSSDLGDGLHLELPLEATNLPEQPLELWVRLVTTDGRKFLTQLPFDANRLGDLADGSPQPLQQDVELAESAQTEQRLTNSLRIESDSTAKTESLRLVDSKPSDDKPRWRSSMQRTDRTSEGFATSSSRSSSWTTQLPGRQAYDPAKLAGRTQPMQAAATTTLQSPVQTQPAWTSGRTVMPAASTTNPPAIGGSSAGWSVSR